MTFYHRGKFIVHHEKSSNSCECLQHTCCEIDEDVFFKLSSLGHRKNPIFTSQWNDNIQLIHWTYSFVMSQWTEQIQLWCHTGLNRTENKTNWLKINHNVHEGFYLNIHWSFRPTKGTKNTAGENIPPLVCDVCVCVWVFVWEPLAQSLWLSTWQSMAALIMFSLD